MPKKLTLKQFIKKSNVVHNKYDYSLVEYKNSSTKVQIICPDHGVFEQRPNDHLSGSGCPKCYGNKKLTTNEFIKKSNVVHNNKILENVDNLKNDKMLKLKELLELVSQVDIMYHEEHKEYFFEWMKDGKFITI